MEINSELLSLFTFTELESNYKITYFGKEPIDLAISVMLKGLDIPAQTIRYKFTTEGEWFVPALDYTGCQTMELRDREKNQLILTKVITPKFSKKNKKQNVICIGLNKTGTSSFVSSLQKVGFELAKEDLVFMKCVQDVYHGDYNTTFSLLENERYNLYDDMPFSFPNFYKKIYQRRPDDVYVLTIRKDVDTWIKSVINFYPILQNGTKKRWEDKSFFHLVLPSEDYKFLINNETPLYEAWGVKNNKDLEQNLRNLYNSHVEKVIEFFTENKSNFKIVDVSKQGEFKSFCNWLGVETETENFDWVNKSNSN